MKNNIEIDENIEIGDDLESIDLVDIFYMIEHNDFIEMPDDSYYTDYEDDYSYHIFPE